MVYHICNRTLYRGFHTCPDGKQKITKGDGKQTKGRWLTGQLVEVPMEVPAGATPQLPLLCICTPGKRIHTISEHTVCANTISQFSGTILDKDWSMLTKAVQDAWLKRHRAEDWIGAPVFEGDIFYHRIEKRYYIVLFDLRKGFYLENMGPGIAHDDWFFDLMVKKGNLWAPPKEVHGEVIQRYHKRRSAEKREDAIVLPHI